MSRGRSEPQTIDARDRPAYGLAEAARYLRLPVATLRAWTVGRRYLTASGQGRFNPLILPARRRPPVLSFSNLVEAHVLRALRTEHGVSVKDVRDAVRWAERELGIQRLLLHPNLRSSAGKVLLERYGELIDLSASGQLAMREVLKAHLRRVEWDELSAVRLHPFVLDGPVNAGMPIAIDPRVSFGRPVLLRRGVSTAAIANRIDAGETVVEVAADYEITPDDVEYAVVYERAA